MREPLGVGRAAEWFPHFFYAVFVSNSMRLDRKLWLLFARHNVMNVIQINSGEYIGMRILAINAGDIEIGKLKSSSANTIGFTLKDLAKHMLIVGTPGSGKTTFIILPI